MMNILRRLLLVLFVFAQAATAQEVPTVAAASDLKFALEEVARAYTQQTGKTVRLAFGASGNLMRQIAQGAPFDLFMSADEQYVLDLHRQGFAVDEGMLYAIGHVVLFVPHGSPIRAEATLEDLRRAVDDGRLKKLSIANPEHAPYGRAARDVLQAAGLWEKVQGRLIMGENVSQAAQYAASGSVQAGLFALSLALSPNFIRAGDHAVLPERWHRPLRQRMVLLKRASPPAREFYAFLQQPAARSILRKYGFALPGE
jgi:molybdate transport system substrate-binding protein